MCEDGHALPCTLTLSPLTCGFAALGRESMKQRILAVDDEPHMLRLMERIITEKTP